MKVLVACEESQTVCKAFRKRGHEAYSCDIMECSGGHNEWHIMQDVIPLLNGNCEFKTVDGTKHKIGIIMPAFFPSSRVTYDGGTVEEMLDGKVLASVTADGVKTYSQILDLLFAAIDTSNLTPKSVLNCGGFGYMPYVGGNTDNSTAFADFSDVFLRFSYKKRGKEK